MRDGYKMTEVGMIPSEWICNEIGNCIDVLNGFAFKSGSFIDSGIKVIKIANITESGLNLNEAACISKEEATQYDAFYANEEDIVIAMTGATTGKVAKVKESDLPCLINQRVGRLKSNIGQSLYSNFLYHITKSKSFQEQIWGLAIGGAQPNISPSQIKSITIPLPPLPEQQKIANILTTVDDHISETEALIEKTRVLKQGLMQQLLTKGIGHTEFKDTEIGRIPVEWEVVKIDETCTLKGGNGFPNKMQGKSFGEYPYFKVSDMNSPGNEKFMILSNNYIDEIDNVQIRATVFPVGTVIFAKVGAALLLNRRRILRVESCIDNNMMGAIPNESVESDYLFSILQTIDFGTFVQDGAVPSVNQAQVGSKIIALPPLAEQRKIAAILTSVDDQIDTHQAKLASLTKLKSGLMQQLLTGKIRVKV